MVEVILLAALAAIIVVAIIVGLLVAFAYFSGKFDKVEFTVDEKHLLDDAIRLIEKIEGEDRLMPSLSAKTHTQVDEFLERVEQYNYEKETRAA